MTYIKLNILLISLIVLSNLASAQTFYEILGRPTESAITINIVFNQSQQEEVYWEYGTSPGSYSLKSKTHTTDGNSAPLVAELTDLLPNTEYYYRTRYRQSGSSFEFLTGEEHSFYTQRAKGSTFTFTIQADPHLYDKKGCDNMIKETMENMQKDKPDFLLDLGDTFGDDHNPFTITDNEIKKLHSDYLPFFNMVCNSAALFLCLGNHEGESGYYLLQTPPNNLATMATKWRKYYYSNPEPNGFYSGNTEEEGNGIGKPQNYYAFEWGDALIVVMDVYRYYTANEKPKGWDWTIGDKQYFWLKNTLENSKAKYKFVFAHHTLGQGRGAISTAMLNEWGGWKDTKKTSYDFDKNRPGWGKPIHQLMVDNAVNIFFQGHDHLFAQEELDGLIYQECPMPSDSTYEIGMLANADAYVSNQLNGTGHIRVTVNPDNSKIDFVRAYLPSDTNDIRKNAEIAFSYTVNPKVTSVENSIPATLQLEQNYPNPFSSETFIRYSVAEAGSVQLKVYDIFGRELSTLVNEYLQPGTYTIPFKVDNLSAQNGMYFYKLTSSNSSETRSMICWE